MKKFVLNIALFLLPIVVLGYTLDKLLCHVSGSVTHAQGEYPVWNKIYGGKLNSDVLVYGSSRALVHFDPEIIADSLGLTVYNVGIDGHNFWLQNLRHKLIEKFNKIPRLIIHSLDMFTLEKRKDLYNPDQFLPYMLGDTEMEEAIKEYKGYKIFDYSLPLLRFYGKTDAILVGLKNVLIGIPSPVNGRINGYKAENRVWNNDLIEAKKKMKSYKVVIDTASIRIFENYLQECKKQGIKVILVYSPEYIEGQQFVENREEVMNIYTNWATKYEIPFYDYSKDSMCYQTRYFYNASHLNAHGSHLFTKKFCTDIKRQSINYLKFSCN